MAIMYNRDGWLDAAMDQVRCKPERRVIRAELLGHLEDKEQQLLESGMSALEAGKAAAAAMGDPVEVGKALDRAHPVFWGYLYTAAKAAVVLLCVVICFFGIDYAVNGTYKDIFNHYPLKIQLYDPAVWGSEDVVILEDTYKPVKQSGYTIDVTQAYWEPVEEYYTAQGIQKDENVLNVDVKVYNPRPWAVAPLFMGRLEVQGDEDIRVEIKSNMSNGDAVVGDIFNVEHNILDEQRYWGAWYFTVRIAGVEYGDTVTLSIPGQDVLRWTFLVEVTE